MIWLILIIVFVLFILGVWFMERKPKVNLVRIKFLDFWISVRERHVSDFNRVDHHIQTYQPHLLAHITRIDSYNARYIRFGVSKVWSYHAYGQAIDINPEEFPMSQDYPYELPVWYRCLAIIFKLYGFRWGGDWSTRFDPMHFEIGERSEDL